jgi:SPP1 family predicted phage head-tail adaptor
VRAGKLDRIIQIKTGAADISRSGKLSMTWTLVATMRAQLIQNTTDDVTGQGGSQTQKTVTFRIRWLDGVTLEQRVTYEGQEFEIKEVKELGRRRGLDLKCVRLGA